MKKPILVMMVCFSNAYVCAADFVNVGQLRAVAGWLQIQHRPQWYLPLQVAPAPVKEVINKGRRE